MTVTADPGPGAPAPPIADEDGEHDGAGTAWEHVGVLPRYPRPTATVDPDRSRGWFGRLRPLVGTHRGAIAVGLGAATVGMLAQVAIPAVLRSAIDRALLERTATLAPFVWALVGLGVARGLLTYAYRYSLHRAAFDLESDLRNLLFEHLSRLPFSFYDRVQSGQIISRANADIRSVQIFLGFAPIMAISLLSSLIAVAFMASIHVPLTVVAVAVLPAVYAVGVRMRQRIFPLSWIVQGRVADLATIVDENIAGVRVVKGFAAEERQIAALARAARRLRWASVQQVRTRARYGPVVENLPRIGLAAVLLYGGLLAIDGEVTVGTLVAFNAYVLLLQVPFRTLGFFLMLGQRARASAGRIFEILDEPVTIADRPGAVDLVAPRGELRFRDVSFAYPHPDLAGRRPVVLKGFDLDVAPGDAVAIVGATGSGKSTVTRLLSRFYDVDGGAVLIDGRNVRDLTLASVRASVATVLDEPFLFSASIHDNIAYARPDASRDVVVAAAVASQAAGFVAALPDGYDTVVGERGYTLSGGQRQRIAIARALVADPAVLVLDDATSAIDVHVEAELHDALRSLRAGRTTVVIAHRLSTIALAERVVLLDGGRVVAQGTHEALLRTEPRYVEVLARTTEAEPADVEGKG